jgi:hypothetical protein
MALTLLFAPGAVAAVVPGTPVAVGPDVPGNGRAWELVTPADPVSALPFFPKGFTADGDALFFTTFGPLPGSLHGYPLVLSGLSRRGSDGWTSTAVPGPDETAVPFLEEFEPNAFNPQLTEWIWTSRIGDVSGSEEAIFRGDAAGGFRMLSRTSSNIALLTPFRGASSDLDHVLFATDMHLVPADAPRTTGQSIYESVGSGVRAVDVADDGSLISNCGSTVPETNPISNDGNRIFFMTDPGCAPPQRAYLREGGATTTLISGSQCTLADCGPEADVTILAATPSGSSAFLITSQRLTNDDTDTYADLYRYDVADGQLTLLSAVPGADELTVTEDKIRIADDGSTVLFWGEDPSVAEGKHLYVAAAGGARVLAPSAEGFGQVSADGRFALLATESQLAAGDVDAKMDVYRYDTSAETFTWLSHGSHGGNGDFDATISSRGQLQFTGEKEATPGSPYRAMTVDGSDVFFTTAEQLLPQDVNEVVDVYEWKAGELSLVSSGVGDRQAIYISPTPDGRTVFFGTATTLLPADRDGGDIDIYAARVGGGFAEPSPAAGCEGEGCFPPLAGPSARPIQTTDGRSTGNIEVRPLGAAARKKAAKSGVIPLLIELPRSGKVQIRGWARLAGKRRLVVSKALEGAAGPIALRLRLSRQARGALNAGRHLRIDLIIELAGTQPQRMALAIGGKR